MMGYIAGLVTTGYISIQSVTQLVFPKIYNQQRFYSLKMFTFGICLIQEMLLFGKQRIFPCSAWNGHWECKDASLLYRYCKTRTTSFSKHRLGIDREHWCPFHNVVTVNLDTANVWHLPSGNRGDEMSVSLPDHQWGRAALRFTWKDNFCPHLCGHSDGVVVATHAHYLRHRCGGGEIAASLILHKSIQRSLTPMKIYSFD